MAYYISKHTGEEIDAVVDAVSGSDAPLVRVLELDKMTEAQLIELRDYFIKNGIGKYANYLFYYYGQLMEVADIAKAEFRYVAYDGSTIQVAYLAIQPDGSIDGTVPMLQCAVIVTVDGSLFGDGEENATVTLDTLQVDAIKKNSALLKANDEGTFTQSSLTVVNNKAVAEFIGAVSADRVQRVKINFTGKFPSVGTFPITVEPLTNVLSIDAPITTGSWTQEEYAELFGADFLTGVTRAASTPLTVKYEPQDDTSYYYTRTALVQNCDSTTDVTLADPQTGLSYKLSFNSEDEWSLTITQVQAMVVVDIEKELELGTNLVDPATMYGAGILQLYTNLTSPMMLRYINADDGITYTYNRLSVCYEPNESAVVLLADAYNQQILVLIFDIFANPIELTIKYVNAVIPDNYISSGMLKNSSVTSGKIASNAITATKMANNSVYERAIYDGVVSTAKIRNLAITTEKVADGAITLAKLADDAKPSGGSDEVIATAPYNVSSITVPAAQVTADFITAVKACHAMLKLTVSSTQVVYCKQVSANVTGVSTQAADVPQDTYIFMMTQTDGTFKYIKFTSAPVAGTAWSGTLLPFASGSSDSNVVEILAPLTTEVSMTPTEFETKYGISFYNLYQKCKNGATVQYSTGVGEGDESYAATFTSANQAFSILHVVLQSWDLQQKMDGTITID